MSATEFGVVADALRHELLDRPSLRARQRRQPHRWGAGYASDDVEITSLVEAIGATQCP